MHKLWVKQIEVFEVHG